MFPSERWTAELEVLAAVGRELGLMNSVKLTVDDGGKVRNSYTFCASELLARPNPTKVANENI